MSMSSNSSPTASRAQASNAVAGTITPKGNQKDGFLTSLAALKEILLLDSSSPSILKASAGPTPDQVQRHRLRDQIRTLQALVADKDKENESLKAQLKESKRQVEEERTARVAMEGVVQEKAILEKELENARKKESDLTKEMTDLREALESMKHKHAREIEKLEGRLKQMSQERVEAMEHADAMDARRMTSDRHAEELIKEKQTAIDTMNRERARLEDTIASLERTVKSQQEQSERTKAKLQADLEKKAAELDETNRMLATTKEQLEIAKKQAIEAGTIKRKLEESVSSVSLLEKKVARLGEDLVSEKSQVTVLQERLEKQRVDSEGKLAAQKTATDEVLNKTVADLQASFDSKESEYTAVKERLESELKEARTTLEAKESLHVSKEKVAKLLKAKSEALEKEKGELGRKLEESVSSVSLAQTKLGRLEEELASEKSQVAAIQEQMEKQKADFDATLQAQSAKAEELLANKVTELNKSFDEKEDQYACAQEKLETDLQVARAAVEARENTLAQREDENKHLLSAKHSLEREVADLKSQGDGKLEAAGPRLADLESQLAEKEKEIQSFREEVELELKAAKDKLLEKSQSLQNMEVALVQSNAQHESSSKDIANLQRKLVEMEKELEQEKQRGSSVEQYEKELEHLRHRNEDLTTQLQQGSGDIAPDLETELQTVSAELAQAQEQLRAKDELLSQLRNRFESTEAEKAELLDRLEKREKEVRQLEEGKAAVLQENNQAAALKNAKEELADMKDELECAEEEVRRCRARISQLEADLGARDAALQAKDGTSTALREEKKPFQHDTAEDTKGAPQINPESADETGEAQTKKRSADEPEVKDEHASSDLESMKAKLLAKKKKQRIG